MHGSLRLPMATARGGSLSGWEGWDGVTIVCWKIGKYSFCTTIATDFFTCSNSCSLRILEEWEKVLTEFDNRVGFIVIINTNDINNIDLPLRAIQFTRPVVLDKNNQFIKKNNLQKIRAKNRTFLLDKKNTVILVGEPLGRPKLLEV